MKYLKTYEQLNLPNESSRIFEYFFKTLNKSIFTWDYFVDFDKAKMNASDIERELNLLNVLIGKENITDEFVKLIRDYPQVLKALPILIAVRENKLREMEIITDIDKLTKENKSKLFEPSIKMTPQRQEDITKFFIETGLLNIFKDKTVKNLVDYCIGVEVGMDTNARKNRTGQIMEKIVEKQINKFCVMNGVESEPQATKNKIKTKWDIDIEVNKTDRRFDMAVFNKTKNKLFLIETNFYSGGGSKLKATAGEYRDLNNSLKSQNIDLIWITDGTGWNTAKKPLLETYINNDYVFNLNLLNTNVLNEIIL